MFRARRYRALLIFVAAFLLILIHFSRSRDWNETEVAKPESASQPDLTRPVQPNAPNSDNNPPAEDNGRRLPDSPPRPLDKPNGGVNGGPKDGAKDGGREDPMADESKASGANDKASSKDHTKENKPWGSDSKLPGKDDAKDTKIGNQDSGKMPSKDGTKEGKPWNPDLNLPGKGDTKDGRPWGADSKGADLKGTDSKGTDLKGADSKGTDSKGTDFMGTDFKGSDSTGTDSKDLDKAPEKVGEDGKTTPETPNTNKSPSDATNEEIDNGGAGRMAVNRPDPDSPIVHWRSLPEQFPVPEGQAIKLPTGQSQTLPTLQAQFKDESTADKQSRMQQLSAVKSAFQHAWQGYKKTAMGHDEVKPLSQGFEDPFNGWGATLVDSLDTMWIMDMKDEFTEAVDAIRKIDFTTSIRQNIPVFETTIRYLGGLLGAYDISEQRHPILLEKAQELAQILIGAFDTPNRMPALYYRWAPEFVSKRHRASSRATLAEIGSLSLEFTRLAQLTKDDKYYDAIARVTNELEKLQDSTTIPGLWPFRVNAQGCSRYKPQREIVSVNSETSIYGAGGHGSGKGTSGAGSPDDAAPANGVNGAPPNGVPANGAQANGVPANGVPANGVPAIGAPANGAPGNGVPGNGAAGNGAPPGGFAPNGVPLNVPNQGASGNGGNGALVKDAFGSNAPANGATGNSVPGNGAAGNGVPPSGFAPNGVPLNVPNQGASGTGIKAKRDPMESECNGGMEVPFSARDNKYSLGGSSDSAYEYLPKEFLLLGGANDQYRKMYKKAMNAVRKNLLFRPTLKDGRNIRFLASTTPLTPARKSSLQSTDLDYEGNHLSCYAGGMFALGAKAFGIDGDLEIAAQLTDGCVWAYESTQTGIMPERFHLLPCESSTSCDWNEDRYQAEVARHTPSHIPRGDPQSPSVPLGMVDILSPTYLLRPEAIESVFIMYRLTGDDAWRRKGWNMFEAIVKHTQTEVAHAAISDVMAQKPAQKDLMESFWLAETLKYFYLLFSDPDVVNLDKYVLNTEAHPFLRS
ncbi:Class I alpha-mannosidase 1A [Penicillium alfredii]|uniref:alpha-1,2-Mannosidase n=1 Tax=Penicillium alfredii TaxID=1506179 RepID=A0A9W9JZ87_9EURO|nr:Class I alpha-mannosidase 1A [Penicillium alfredii]KAJ5086851.1 Class I alpha-mannosidase 1A [Penicillium alfredii]